MTKLNVTGKGMGLKVTGDGGDRGREAYKILDKKFGEGYTDHLMHNALEILKNESLSYFYR